MILAERQHLEDLMQQQAVEIRIKEEKVVSKSFRTLSSIATYLAAAAFAILRAAPAYLLKNVAYLDKNSSRFHKRGFRYKNDPETEYLILVTESLASIAIGFCVLVLVISSWCLIFGTELAFRGADQGSMSRAVDGLYAERKYAIRFFMCAVATTVLSGVSHTLLVMRDDVGRIVPTTLLVCSALGSAVYMNRRVRPRFKFLEGNSKNNAADLFFAGGFDPEIRRNVEMWHGDQEDSDAEFIHVP